MPAVNDGIIVLARGQLTTIALRVVGVLGSGVTDSEYRSMLTSTMAGLVKAHWVAYSACLCGLGFAVAGATGTAYGEPVLSPAQSALIARHIMGLGAMPERHMAERWSDAKKVAEFICRPAALSLFRRHMAGADKVFLGLGENDDLELKSSRLLAGRGEVRTPAGWKDFSFRCRVDPLTGRVLAFEPVLSGQGPR